MGGPALYISGGVPSCSPSGLSSFWPARQPSASLTPVYQEAVDRYSAYEKLKDETDAREQAEREEAEQKALAKQEAEERKAAARQEAEQKKAATAKKKQQSAAGKAFKKVAKTATNSLLDRVGRKIGKAIARGIFGNWR